MSEKLEREEAGRLKAEARVADLESKIVSCTDCGAENIADPETSFCRKCDHPIWPKEENDANID